MVIKVLVTGANGMIGQRVVTTLAQNGIPVRALVRSKVRRESNLPIEYAVGDIRDRVSVHAAMQGVTHVIHLAARKSDELDSEAVNVHGTQNLVDAAQAMHVMLFIHVSTPSAMLKGAGTYGSTKLKAEQIVEQSKLPWLILRPSVVYTDFSSGILGSMHKFIGLPVVPMIGSGSVTFAPIHGDDFANLMLIFVRNTPNITYRAFDVGGPQVITFKQMLLECMHALGKNKTIVTLPVPVAMMLARVCELIGVKVLTVSNVRGATESVPLDLEALKSLIPYPARSFTQGLKDILEKSHTDDHSEAQTLLSYVVKAGKPSAEECERYDRACGVHGVDVHHVLSKRWLGAMDASTKLLAPQCMLQKKLLIACAVGEASTRSAAELLPREESIVSIAMHVMIATLLSTWNLLCGLAVRIVAPSFWKHHAGL